VEARTPSDSVAVVARWMRITEANSRGAVHGGTVLQLADETAALSAIRHARSLVVTASVDRVVFRRPIEVGELLTLKASVNAAWRTSMEVGVRVESENVRSGEVLHTSTAYLTMVALDDEGKPTEVPPIAPETPDEIRRAREAQLRRDNRLAERQWIEEERARV
jgi:acyl-CoA hydrolase